MCFRFGHSSLLQISWLRSEARYFDASLLLYDAKADASGEIAAKFTSAFRLTGQFVRITAADARAAAWLW
jgi:hypothetical protein